MHQLKRALHETVEQHQTTALRSLRLQMITKWTEHLVHPLEHGLKGPLLKNGKGS